VFHVVQVDDHWKAGNILASVQHVDVGDIRTGVDCSASIGSRYCYPVQDVDVEDLQKTTLDLFVYVMVLYLSTDAIILL